MLDDSSERYLKERWDLLRDLFKTDITDIIDSFVRLDGSPLVFYLKCVKCVVLTPQGYSPPSWTSLSVLDYS